MLYACACDGVLDREDLARLERVASSGADRHHLEQVRTADSVHLEFAEPILPTMSSLIDRLIGNGPSWPLREIVCHVAHDYALDDHVGQHSTSAAKQRWKELSWGALEAEIRVVAHLGQSDVLEHTTNDHSRCGAAATVNALILGKGLQAFPALAARLSLPHAEATYRNLALAQENLYVAARAMSEPDDAPGLSLRKEFFSLQAKGSLGHALGIAELERTVLGQGKRVRTIEKFARSHEVAVALLGGHLDQEKKLFFPREPSDHVVVVLKYGSAYFYVDSAARMGIGDAVEPLSPARLQEFDNSTTFLIGVARRN